MKPLDWCWAHGIAAQCLLFYCMGVRGRVWGVVGWGLGVGAGLVAGVRGRVRVGGSWGWLSCRVRVISCS